MPTHVDMDASLQHAHLIELESQVVVAQLQLEDERDENTRYRNQVKIYEAEIEEYRKVQNANKREIKKLLTANDNLRRELSKIKGMRQFTTERHCKDNCECRRSAGDLVDPLREELDITKVKLKSLKEHMMSITASMITALENDLEDGFKVVQKGRRRRVSKPKSQQTANSAAIPENAIHWPKLPAKQSEEFRSD